jgi:hypothetical protein
MNQNVRLIEWQMSFSRKYWIYRILNWNYITEPRKTAGCHKIFTNFVITKAQQFQFSKSKMEIALEVSQNQIGHQLNKVSMRATWMPNSLIWLSKEYFHAPSPHELSDVAKSPDPFLVETICSLIMSHLTKRVLVGHGWIRAVTIFPLIMTV